VNVNFLEQHLASCIFGWATYIPAVTSRYDTNKTKKALRSAEKIFFFGAKVFFLGALWSKILKIWKPGKEVRYFS
jgi:hypothetical protein